MNEGEREGEERARSEVKREVGNRNRTAVLLEWSASTAINNTEASERT